MPGAIEGEGGHNTLFSVSCRLVHGFGLSIEQAMSLLKREYNPRCDPPWTDKELLHKCEQASKAESHEQPREHLVGDVPPWEKEATPEPEPEPAKKSSVFLPGREVLADAVIAIGNREGETIFNCGPDLEGFEIGFGKVTVVGAPPGTGLINNVNNKGLVGSICCFFLSKFYFY
jgi:hypothetical protein